METVTKTRRYRGFTMTRVDYDGTFDWRTTCIHVDSECPWRRYHVGPAGLKREIDEHILDHARKAG